MPKPTVLFLLVGYHNMAEVGSFIEEVRAHSTGAVFAVCDNSESGRDVLLDAEVVVCRRPDNPGYLDGGREALQAYIRSTGREPEWVVLSNTDLRLLGDPFERVLSTYDPDIPLVLAPRITEGLRAVEMNPHVLARRSSARLQINRLLTATPTLAVLYLTLAHARLHFRERRVVPPAAPGTQMHSPYGANIIFSRAFIQQVGLPANVPLLAEEFAIAEQARVNSVPVLFEPRLHLHHDPHTTTGPGVSRKRGRMLSKAFRFIARSQRATPESS